MENISGSLRIEPSQAGLSDLLNKIGVWEGGNGLALLVVFLLGSAFWQASSRVRAANDHFDPLNQLTYSWRHDVQLLTYLTLLFLLIGVSVLIALSPLSNLTFWLGYMAVAVAQLTSVGPRIGNFLVRQIESVFLPRQQAVSTPSRELVR